MAQKKEIDSIAIGQRIRDERKKLGLSREEFAELLGLSDYYVGQLERGERQMSLPVLVKIAKCLHVSLDYLIWGKIPSIEPSVNEPNDNYTKLNDEDLNELLGKCSSKELGLIKKLIKAVLPYVNVMLI
jgi:transcriptional regulator with XRE-family HTH domain